ncbi:NDUB6 dehydrogenase, partial [Polyodon spathula]|nr:NDUB6 dehydrogenase [Polyodon spathula]
MSGYTPDEKLRMEQLTQLRRKWLKDQELSPREPVLPPQKQGPVAKFWSGFLQPNTLWRIYALASVSSRRTGYPWPAVVPCPRLFVCLFVFSGVGGGFQAHLPLQAVKATLGSGGRQEGVRISKQPPWPCGTSQGSHQWSVIALVTTSSSPVSAFVARSCSLSASCAWIMETHVRRAYVAGAKSTHLANTFSMLTAYLDGILCDALLPEPVALEL